VSSLRRGDPLASPSRELRRLAVSAAVATTYSSRDADVDATLESRAQAERLGFDEGYQRGLSAGAADAARARAEEEARVASLASALSQATREMIETTQRLRRELEQTAPALAYALVEEILGRELDVASNPGRDAIMRALAFDDARHPATVRMNPDDLRRLGDVADLGLEREVVVVADASIDVGGVIVDVGDTTVDAQLSTALERVKRALVGSTVAEVSDDRAA
jgi:flagellar assembly protein FliH